MAWYILLKPLLGHLKMYEPDFTNVHDNAKYDTYRLNKLTSKRFDELMNIEVG
jgi:hypothetical protein